MLVCHCNVISDTEIEQVILDFLREDPWQLVVPAKVYHALMQRGRCSGCFPSVVEIIIRVTEDYHRQLDADAARLSQAKAGLQRLRRRHQIYGARHERRTAGHRAA